MKTILLFVFALLTLAPQAIGQKKSYVCQPCGLPCDEEVHSQSGNCKLCQMPLVDKATVTFTNLSPKAFCARIAANPNALILDVRSPGEFAGTITGVASYGHFKNAKNIFINDLSKRLDEINSYKDREVLIYCSQNHRSPRAAYYLAIQGFKNIKNMTGGVSKLNGLTTTSCFKQNYVEHKP